MCLMLSYGRKTAVLYTNSPSTTHSQNYSKSQCQMSRLLFLRIEILGLCCFRASRVVAGGTNERLEARCVRKCPSCRFDAWRRLQHSDTCYSELQFDNDHSQLSFPCGTSIKMKACSLQKWVDERRWCGCRCASPVPPPRPDQPRARELCLDLLRLNQMRQGTRSGSGRAIREVRLVLLK
jgi:hypothetical protein